MVKSPALNILIYCFFFLIAVLSIPVDQALSTDTRPNSWAFLGGYGKSYPGWGQTTQRVETIDFIPRYNLIVVDEIGSGWYKGFHSALFEFPVSLILNPEISSMIGINFLASYTFTVNDQLQPYIFAGGGPVYIFADVLGMGTKLNGNYQFGIGLEYFLNKQNHLLFECRYHHISNAGTAKPNEPLNSSKFIVGITF